MFRKKVTLTALKAFAAVTLSIMIAASAGCPSKTKTTCDLSFFTINGVDAETVSELTLEDDAAPQEDGFQIDIVISAAGLDDGEEITLTGGDEAATTVVMNEEAQFEGYTIPVDTLVTLMAAAGDEDCNSPTKSLMVRSSSIGCRFVGLENEEHVSCSNPGQDSLPDEPGLQMNLNFSCTDVPDGTTITLMREGTEVDSQNLSMGSTTFENVFLVGGGADCSRLVQLQALVQTDDPDNPEVVPLALNAECCDSPACEVVGYLPEDPIQGMFFGPTFNRSTDADTFTPGMQTQVGIQTDSSRVWKVGVRVTHIETDDSNEYFVENISSDEVYIAADPIDLPEGNVKIEPLCVMEDQTTPFSYPSESKTVYVDTVPPDCPPDVTCQLVDPRVAEFQCTWSTPNDPGVNQDIEEWDFRFSTSIGDLDDCTEATLQSQWQGLNIVPGSETIPSSNHGTQVNQSFQPFDPGLEYCMGLRTIDYAGNRSECVAPHWAGEIEIRRSWLSPCATGEYCSFGFAVTSVDLNCDGYKDVVIGASQKRQSGSDTGDGQVYVYFGGPAGISTNATPDLILKPEILNGGFGLSLAGLGNFSGHTGDDAGCEDLAIGAGYYNVDGVARSGAVFIFRGRQQWTSLELTENDADLAIHYDKPDRPGWEMFGLRVANIGDFDGDGRPDIAISSPIHRDTGAVFVYKGRDIPYSNGNTIVLSAIEDADFTVLGASKLAGWEFRDGFGFGLSAAGDLDSDGYDDFIIGAHGISTTGDYSLSGNAYIVFGGDPADGTVLDVNNPGDRITTISPDSGGTIINTNALGRQVAGIGDINGDGFLDIAIADPDHGGDVQDATEQYGAVYVFFGNASGFRGQDLVIEIDQADIWIRSQSGGNDRFGIGLGSSVEIPGRQLGDFNNDGLPDLFIGAAAYSGFDGSVFFLYGDTSLVSSQSWIDWDAASFWLHPPAPCGRWGEVIGWAGDINGDGYSDVIVGDFIYPHICDPDSEWRGRAAILF